MRYVTGTETFYDDHPTPAEVKALRTRFGYSQTVFGEMLYVALRTVRDRERAPPKHPPGFWGLPTSRPHKDTQKPPST